MSSISRPMAGRGKNSGSVLVAVVFFIIAAVFFGIGAFLKLGSDRLSRVCTYETEGTVKSIYSRYETRSAGKHRTQRELYHYLILTYIYDGKRYTIYPGTPVSKEKYRIGQKISIRIDPGDPSEVFVEALHKGDNAVFVMLLTGGAVFSGLALIQIWRKRKNNFETDLTAGDGINVQPPTE